jgi:hypothetical protein
MKLPNTSPAVLPLQRHVVSLRAQYGFPHWWEPLYQSAGNAAIFLSREWVETWLQTYGKNFKGVWLWWTYNGQVVGGCLLLVKPVNIGGLYFDTLFLNAAGVTRERSPLAECNDVLFVDGYQDKIAKDMAAFLTDLEWDRMALTACCSGGLMSRVVKLLHFKQIETEDRAAPYVDFPSLNETPFDRNLTSNTRSQIHRSQRLYEEGSGPVALTVAPTVETAMQYFDAMMEMHNSRWSS